MRFRIALFVVIASLFFAGERAIAQSFQEASQNLEDLRRQLSEVKDNEAGVKIRLQELEVELRPENIERHFNGYGSTRPEELREARRKQLQIEKDRLEGQLWEMGESQIRLESAITSAQAKLYQQSALGSTSINPDHPMWGFLFASARTVFGTALILIVVSLLIWRITIRRRLHI